MGVDEEMVVQYIMPLPQNLPPRDFYLSLKVFSQGEDIVMKQAFNEVRRSDVDRGGVGSFLLR